MLTIQHNFRNYVECGKTEGVQNFNTLINVLSLQNLSYTFTNVDEVYSRAQFSRIRHTDNLPLARLFVDFTLPKKCTHMKQLPISINTIFNTNDLFFFEFVFSIFSRSVVSQMFLCLLYVFPGEHLILARLK